MKSFSKLFLLLSFLIPGLVSAAEVTTDGKAYVISKAGSAIVAGGQDITGTIDITGNTLAFDSWTFFGSLVSATNAELLLPGTHTRGAGTVVVGPGQLGAYLDFEWPSSSYSPTFMVWDVVGSGTVFTIVDSDNDGVPGHTITSGPLKGLTVYYEFTVNNSEVLTLSLETNGTTFECLNGGSTVNFIATSEVFGGAVLESITWELNGSYFGEGGFITEFLPLGDHLVTATAITTSGLVQFVETEISVVDTTPPNLDVKFFSLAGEEITFAQDGQFSVSINHSDDCLQTSRIISSNATPTSTIDDGDVITVDPVAGIELPVTAVEVTVRVTDERGNYANTSNTVYFQ